MKRVWRHILAGATALTGGVILTAACVHDNSTIFVYDVLAPQLVMAGQQCKYTSDTTQPVLSSGELDVALASQPEYIAEFLVGNQMVPQINPATPQDETSFVTIQGAVIRILDSAGNQLTTYTRLTAGTIPPLTGTTPSFAPISVLIVDPATIASPGVTSVLSSGGVVRLVTYTRFFGQTTGGDNVESNEFEFPVDVCRGCLIEFSPQDELAGFMTPNCGNALTNSATSSLPVPCILGQDSFTDCSQCLTVAECNPPLIRDGTVFGDAGSD